MRKIFKVMKIKEPTFLIFFLALAANGNFVPFLPAEKIVIDFGGKKILASDLVAYVIFFNKYQAGSDGHQERIKKLEEWYEKAEKPDLRSMSSNEFATAFKRVIEQTRYDECKTKLYKDKTVEEVMQTELMAERFSQDALVPINDLIAASKKRGCVHTWLENEDKGSLTFVLKNGKISEKEFPKLFEKLRIPFKLIFANITGDLVPNETLKQRVTSIEFNNCKLTIERDCFRDSKYLEALEFFQSIISLKNGAFAKCSNFKAASAEKTNLFCLPPNSYSEVFKDTLKEKNIADLIIREFCRLCDGSYENKALAAFVQCNGIDTSALKRYHKIIFEEEIQNETQEKYKVYDEKLCGRETRCKAIEAEGKKLKKEIEHQKSANENLRADMEVLVRKNKILQSSLEDSSKICEVRLNEFLKLENTYKNSEKEHAEAIEKLTKELEKIRSNFASSNEKLEKYKTSFNDAKDELNALKQENEGQKEEIGRLKAFKSKWEEKIPTFERLETEKTELAKQLETAKTNEINSKRMLGKERTQNKENLKKKNEEISYLKQELEETKNLLFNAQAKIKELQNSEAHILTTVGGALADDEDEKEEEKSNAFRSEFVSKKNFKNYLPTSNRKKNKVWKNFEYPKNDK